MYLTRLEVSSFNFSHLGFSLTRYLLADRLPQIYYTLNKLNVETGAFAQLTRKYMAETFNPHTPDVKDVRCVQRFQISTSLLIFQKIFFLWSRS